MSGDSAGGSDQPGREVRPSRREDPALRGDPEAHDAHEVESGSYVPTGVDERLELFEARFHRGPLPTPEMLRQYDEVLPGCARRMVELWENQTQHRQRLERRMVEANISNRSRGQIMAFIIAMTAIIGGIVLVAAGDSAAGLATIFVPLSTLVGVFIYSQLRARMSEGTGVGEESASQGEDSPSS